jgi:hypothetical protein
MSKAGKARDKMGMGKEGVINKESQGKDLKATSLPQPDPSFTMLIC